MQLTLDSAVLSRAMSRAKRTVATGDTIPILTTALLEAGDDGLTIVTTDTQAWLRQRLEVQVDGAGRLAADARKLTDLAARLPKGSQIALKAKGSTDLRLTSGRSRFRLLTFDAADFPVEASVGPDRGATLDTAPLLEALDFVAPSMSREETRYYLNGCYLHGLGDRLVVVATDGHSLRKIDLAKPEAAGDFLKEDEASADGVILPRHALSEVCSLFRDQGEVTVALSEGLARFSAGDLVYTTRLVDGSFPDYARAIPSGEADTVVEVQREAFRNALARIAPFAEVAGDGTRAPIVALRVGEDTVRIAATSTGAEACDEVEAAVEGQGRDIAYNGAYLIAGLDSFKGPRVRISMHGSDGISRIEDPDAGDRLMVLMPRRGGFPETKL